MKSEDLRFPIVAETTVAPPIQLDDTPPRDHGCSTLISLPDPSIAPAASPSAASFALRLPPPSAVKCSCCRYKGVQIRMLWLRARVYEYGIRMGKEPNTKGGLQGSQGGHSFGLSLALVVCHQGLPLSSGAILPPPVCHMVPLEAGYQLDVQQ
ncbi:hypothetical protein R6Q59_006883 [Mikania micrantha]